MGVRKKLHQKKVWRLLQAFLDADQLGTSLNGLIRRVAFAASGLFYLGLAAATVQMTFAAHATNDNRTARDWNHWALTKPLGRALVAAIAICFALSAIGPIVKVIHAPYRRRLQAGLLTREAAAILLEVNRACLSAGLNLQLNLNGGKFGR